MRFGGYTSVGFNSKSEYTLDNNAFIFSIDKKRYIMSIIMKMQFIAEQIMGLVSVEHWPLIYVFITASRISVILAVLKIMHMA